MTSFLLICDTFKFCLDQCENPTHRALVPNPTMCASMAKSPWITVKNHVAAQSNSYTNTKLLRDALKKKLRR